MRYIFAALCLFVPAQAQEDHGHRIVIPDSSQEGPADVGVRAHTNHRIYIKPAGTPGPTGMSPADLRAIYKMDTVQDSSHGIIAIVGAFDYPTALSDFNTFSAQFQLPTQDPNEQGRSVFEVLYVDQGATLPNTGWAQEAALDIEWSHAMAPNAKIILVLAKSNSYSDLFKAVDLAFTTGASQISMSWGSSEFRNQKTYDSSFKNGPVWFASSGDMGGKTSYPSTSPSVVAVGGTRVVVDAQGNVTETGWSGSGGGSSSVYSKPPWQTISGKSRMVPDISSDADPETGVSVYAPNSSTPGSSWQVYGGTSVSAPCMAGMVNYSGQTYGSSVDLLTKIYVNLGSAANYPLYYRDIKAGSVGRYTCKVGWDFVTGVGSPLATGGF